MLGLPKMLTPPKQVRNIAATVAVGGGTALGGPIGGAVAGSLAKNVLEGNKGKKQKKAAASKAAHAHSSTSTALADTPGSGEPQHAKPRGFLDAILSIFGG